MSDRRVLELCLCCDADALTTLAREELGAAEHPRQLGSLSPRTSDYLGIYLGNMGWLWGSSSSSTDDLDSSLQDFLKKEAPSGPKPTLPSAPAKKPAETSSPISTTPSSPAQRESAKAVVPPESQFQDGRYAHLWKNYTPQDVLDDRGKNEQDKLRDLVESYNDRKAGIGRIAMENCALEYMEQWECFQNPKTWKALGTLCNAESRKFNRCHEIQSKFLKALGYLTMDERSQEESEKIQMHADKLYQQMLQQEAAIEKAEREGRERPKFQSLLSNQNISQTLAGGKSQPQSTADPLSIEEDAVWSKIKPEKRAEYQKKIAALSPELQEVERLAAIGELKAQSGISKQVEETFIEERINRMKRREAGQATIGDQIKYWWGWG
jgi:hypothetical protein